jgi:bifunctional DNA-binding transcriptional regulator/antitoxin component of YhaV-PrlF toxin-antitoxin module
VVSIRDGRTSSERVRRVREAQRAEAMAEEEAALGEGATAPAQEDVTYHEYVVVDNAGRLQLPGEYLEALGLAGRAEVELTDGGILVKPAQALDDAPAQVARRAREADSAEASDEGGRQPRLSRGLRGLFSRRREDTEE